MAGIPNRGLSATAVARIDADAAAHGLSRSEYLRHHVEHGVPGGRDTVVVMADLRRAVDAVSDLLDDEV